MNFYQFWTPYKDDYRAHYKSLSAATRSEEPAFLKSLSSGLLLALDPMVVFAEAFWSQALDSRSLATGFNTLWQAVPWHPLNTQPALAQLIRGQFGNMDTGQRQAGVRKAQARKRLQPNSDRPVKGPSPRKTANERRKAERASHTGKQRQRRLADDREYKADYAARRRLAEQRNPPLESARLAHQTAVGAYHYEKNKKQPEQARTFLCVCDSC
jgi:hypothetical protein